MRVCEDCKMGLYEQRIVVSPQVESQKGTRYQSNKYTTRLSHGSKEINDASQIGRDCSLTILLCETFCKCK